MAVWASHKLANPSTTQLELHVGDRVVSTTDLPGVPAGKRGRVRFVRGLSRLRYYVRFENGVDCDDLDGRDISPVQKK